MVQTRKTCTLSAGLLAAQEATPISNPLRTSPSSTSAPSGRTVSDHHSSSSGRTNSDRRLSTSGSTGSDRHSSSSGRTNSDHWSSIRAPPPNRRRTAHGSEVVSRATSDDPPARRRGIRSGAAARRRQCVWDKSSPPWVGWKAEANARGHEARRDARLQPFGRAREKGVAHWPVTHSRPVVHLRERPVTGYRPTRARNNRNGRT